MSTSLDDPSSTMAAQLPTLLAQAAESTPLTSSQIALYLLGIVFFLVLNAFFVASEFAIIRVRKSQLDMAEGQVSPKKLRIARKVTSQVEEYLSVIQMGVTITSLGLGALGTPFVTELIAPLLNQVPGIESPFLWIFGFSWLKAISFVISTASFTFLHVVLGELIPKSFTIRKTMAVTMFVVGPLSLFRRCVGWASSVMNASASGIMKHVLRMERSSEGEDVHTAEELALLVAESERNQHVTETEREILINALELNEIEVKDIMTPRGDVIELDINSSFEEQLKKARECKHTRFPLVEGNLDHPLGLIHIKDIIDLIGQEKPQLTSIKRELKAVPGNMPLDELLQYFLSNQHHVALVVDEYGSSVGLVFLDDVLEELVGEIKDEFDAEEQEIQQIGEYEYLVEGSMSLHDFDDYVTDIRFEDEEVSTVGGLVTEQLGRLPTRGEQVKLYGWLATVTKADGRRVIQVHFKQLPKAATEGEEEETFSENDKES